MCTLTNANSNFKVFPNDQEISHKDNNLQLFLIILSEILKAVHQEILNSLVNVNRHKNTEMDLVMHLNTSLIFVALEIWLSTLPIQILKTMSLKALPLTSGVLAFTFSFQQLLPHIAFLPYLLFCKSN